MGHCDASKLTPWKPGQSGNPKGKPKGTQNSKSILKKYLEARTGKISQITGDEMTYFESIYAKMIHRARSNGDLAAQREILNRYEGMPKQTIEATETIKDELGQMTEAQLKKRARDIVKRLKIVSKPTDADG